MAKRTKYLLALYSPKQVDESTKYLFFNEYFVETNFGRSMEVSIYFY